MLDWKQYDLIIFDKDGTLIDFNAMWAAWLLELARRLEAGTGQALAGDLFRFMAYDAEAGSVIAGGRLAITPMAELYGNTATFLAGRGVPARSVRDVLRTAWHLPDPVVLARPLADLALLFASLHGRGLRVAVATSDNRAGTAATLAAAGVAHLVDALLGADDGVPIKPLPDMVWELCRRTGCAHGRTVVVGDAVVDLLMARAAGALAVGVTSGLATEAQLRPHADLVIDNVGELI